MKRTYKIIATTPEGWLLHAKTIKKYLESKTIFVDISVEVVPASNKPKQTEGTKG